MTNPTSSPNSKATFKKTTAACKFTSRPSTFSRDGETRQWVEIFSITLSTMSKARESWAARCTAAAPIVTSSAPALGHGRDDRSLAFKVGRQHPDGLLVKLFSEGGDPLKNRDYIFEMHGAGPFAPSKKRQRASAPIKPVALNSSVPDSNEQDFRTGDSSLQYRRDFEKRKRGCEGSNSGCEL